MMEHPTGDVEVSVLFLKFCFLSNGRSCYYIDTCGVGIDIVSNRIYKSVLIKLIAFSIQFQIARKQLLKVVQ